MGTMNMAIHQIRFAAAALALVAGISSAGVLSSPTGPAELAFETLSDSGVTFTPISDTDPTAPPTLPGVIAHSDIPDLPGRLPSDKKDGAWEWTHDDSARLRTVNPILDLNNRLFESGEGDPRNSPPPPPPPPIEALRGPSSDVPPLFGGSVIADQLPGLSNSTPVNFGVPTSQIPTPSAVVLLGLGGLTSLSRRRR